MVVPLGWGPLNNQPHLHLIYWLFIGYIPFWRAPWRVKQLGYHPKGTSNFPMNLYIIYQVIIWHQPKPYSIFEGPIPLESTIVNSTLPHLCCCHAICGNMFDNQKTKKNPFPDKQSIDLRSSRGKHGINIDHNILTTWGFGPNGKILVKKWIVSLRREYNYIRNRLPSDPTTMKHDSVQP